MSLNYHFMLAFGVVVLGMAEPLQGQGMSVQGAANARRAAMRIAKVVVAYQEARSDLLGEAAKVRLCHVSFRSRVPMAPDARDVVSNAVGANRQLSCSSPTVNGVVVVVDSVSLQLTQATIFARVQRGSVADVEIVKLEAPFGAKGEWAVRELLVNGKMMGSAPARVP